MSTFQEEKEEQQQQHWQHEEQEAFIQQQPDETKPGTKKGKGGVVRKQVGKSIEKIAKATFSVKRASTHQVKKATQQVKRGARKLKVAGDLLTNSKLFQQVVDNIFMRCDADKNGLISQDELYSAILLIHLKLAKRVGPAACSPPKRKTVIRLFNASDLTNTGHIDREEFNQIAKMCCTQILGRIATYWCCMVLLAPIVAHACCDYYNLPEGSLRERAMEKLLTICIMAIALPAVWDIVDDRMERHALIKKEINTMEASNREHEHDD